MTWGMSGIGNDTIYPGFGITKFPVNFTSFNYLNDGTIRNWGGESQYVTYGAPMMDALQRMLAYKFNDPNHISQWNPLLIGYDLGQYETDPALTQQGIQQAYNLGFQMRQQMQMQGMVRSIANTLGSIEQQLSAIIKSKNIPDEQKEKLQAILEEVQAKKEEIAEKIKNKPSMEELEAIYGEVIEFTKEISEKIGEVTEELKESSSKTDKTDKTDKKKRTQKPSETDTNEDGIETDVKTGRPTELGDAPKKSDIEAICSGIDSAYAAWYGTDKEELDNNLAKLDATNIIEVIYHWNKNYKDNSSGKSEFFESMMAELNDFEQDNRIPAIVKALTERAEALGIYDEIANEVGNINKELHSSWESDSKLVENLKSMFEKIQKKETENANNSKSKADKAKTDKAAKEKAEKAKANKAKTEKENNAKELFINDMREIWKDDSLEVSDRVQYKDGKFVIRIEGKNYEGRDFNALVKAIKAAGYDPKEYLMKKKLDKAA